MYRIERDQLVGDNVAHVETKKKNKGKITPKFLVIHYTASDNYGSDVKVLSEPGRSASCHLVIAHDGHVTQIGSFKDGLWHAGESSWRGYAGLNSHSIGIEVTCPGPIDGDQARYGKKHEQGQLGYEVTSAAHKNGGPVRKWAIFTDAQIKAVEEIGILLMQHYDLKEAVGHDDIAPRRKIDPGPSCPVSLLQFLNGDKADEQEPERPDLPSTGQRYRVKGVTPDTLTFRASPNGEKRGELAENQTLEKIGENGNWMQVRTPAGYVGWVYAEYLVAV